MTTYLGYMTTNMAYVAERGQKVRAGEPAVDQWAINRVRELRNNVPEGCVIHGSYNPISGPSTPITKDHPGMLVVETDDLGHLSYISAHYAGLFDISWAPGIFTPGPASEVEATLAQVERDATGGR